MSDLTRQQSQPRSSPHGTKQSIAVKSAILLCILAMGIVFALSAFIGWRLTHPERRPVDVTPAAWGLAYETVSFTSRIDKLPLQGWVVPAHDSRLTVIAAHGYGRNRLQDDVPLLPIVQALINQGCNVVLFDFRNSGESAGTMTSIGQYEIRDLLGAVDFARTRPELNKPIVLYGFSMGAATALVAGAQEPAVAGVIADSPFADLDSYLSENLSVWSHLPAIPFNAAILSVTPLVTGLDTAQVSPLKAITNFNNRPVLLIHGEADTDIPLANSELLQARYPAADLLRIPGAVHVGSFRQDSAAYLTGVSRFLEQL